MSQIQMKELIEGTTAIIRKRLSVFEPAFSIESQRRLESGSAPGLEAEPVHPSSTRFTDDVLKERGGNPFAEVIGIGPHRFQFSGPIPEFLQGGDSCQFGTVPCGPHGNVRRLQS